MHQEKPLVPKRESDLFSPLRHLTLVTTQHCRALRGFIVCKEINVLCAHTVQLYMY